MNKRFNVVPRIICSLLVSLLYMTSAHAQPANISLAKKEARNYYESGQYEQELTQKITQAQQFLLKQITYYSSHKTDKKLALVLDIDETCLSNYSKIARRDFSGNPTQIHKEILAADDPAIKPMLKLYQTALKNGISVFFVTGRQKSELAATKTNLINAGYTKWTNIYLRPNDYSQASIIPFKSQTRAKIEQQGYIVLASIGDQYSDIRGGYAKKGFKLPNPFYHIP